jgi:hypothetical protein
MSSSDGNTVTWDEFEIRLNLILEDIRRNSKRVLKKEVPKSSDSHLDIINKLCDSFNSFSRLINKNWYKLNENQQSTCILYFNKIREKVEKAFQVLDCQYEVPSQLITRNNLINNLIVLEAMSKDKKEKMALSMNDFFNLAGKILPNEFNGDISKLQSFVDAISLLQVGAAEHEENAVLFVKTRLTGKARSLITTEKSLVEIIGTLKKGLKGDSASLVGAKLSKLRQNNKDIVEYASEMEKLTDQLQAAYLAEGMPVHLATKYTTEAAVKSLIDNSASERIKTVIAAGNFTTPQEVMTKLVSINVGNNQSTGSVLHYKADRNKFVSGNTYFPQRNTYFPQRRHSYGNHNGENNFHRKNNYDNSRKFHVNQGNRRFTGYREKPEEYRNKPNNRFNNDNKYRNVRMCESEETRVEDEQKELGF